MATVLQFDELNKLRSIPIDKYFDEMDLTDRQKKERKSLAEDIEEAMMLFLYAAAEVLTRMPKRIDGLTEAVLTANLVMWLTEAYTKYDMPEEFSSQYAARISQELVRATIDHAFDDDGYYISADRARLVGEEESNTAFNNKDYLKAIAKGKSKKQWLTMRDKRVRPTHVELEGVTIPINDYFQVGAAKMLFPRDVMNAGEFPEEIVNCRCQIRYT